MSKAFKSIGKVFKSVGKAVSKTVQKVVKSKVFKIAAAAAVVYFGGAALTSMATPGGSLATGLQSAWSGLQSAGSSIMSGNIGAAGSALKSGFMGSAGAATGTAASLAPAASTSFVQGGSLANAITAPATVATNAAAAAAPTVAATAPAAAPGLFGLGEMGTAALVGSGINIAGQTIAGAAQDKAEREARERLTYAGMNGSGQGNLNTSGLFNPMPASNITPQTAQYVPKTVDELVKAYGG